MRTKNFKWIADSDGEWLCFQTKESMGFLKDWNKDKEYEVEIKEYHSKRSLNANAYAFKLMTQLACKNGITVTELYKRYIKELAISTTIVCCKNNAVDTLCKQWENKGIGWLTDKLDSKLDGCTNVVLYYGSSTFDTKEMSRLIDSIVQDCESVGIPTMTKEEEQRLLEEWRKEHELRSN